MNLDVLIATRNRSSLLRKALLSLLEADVPPGFTVAITVVDNNSSDDTARVVKGLAFETQTPVRYLFERRPGKAFALNTAIASTNGDLVGFIDDDERIHPSWYANISGAFRDSTIDFIGGPYVPDWSVPPPEWLPRQARGIIGCSEFSSVPKPYGKELPKATLFGGNAVIRRSLLNRAGPYRTDIAPHDDQELFERLLANGAKGMYLPELVIYHWIPRERLRKRYFREWVWKAGPQYARMHKNAEGIRTSLGIPCYLFRKMLQSLASIGWRSISCTRESSRFEAELDFIYSLSLAVGYRKLKMTNVP